ncbi:MAG TPA: DUF697 domain-containing protein [Stellaceae bacterium]|nr:DUF697 domain-containing protein [Stellaceae bacterium]
MTKTLPRLRTLNLEDIKRTAPPVILPELPPGPEPEEGEGERVAAARAIVKRYRNWAIAASASPLPFVDAALIAGVQLRMITRLAKLYEVPFERVRVESLVTALFGGWTPYSVTVGLAGAAARLAPGVGTLVGIATSVGTSVLATETIGKIFIRHFESGGTFLDFDPKHYRRDRS